MIIRNQVYQVIICMVVFILAILSGSKIIIAGECVRTGSECIEAGGTRQINGFAITKDCWMYRDAYKCTGFAKNNCEALVEEGCVQMDSSCKEYKNNWCVSYEKNFKCEKEEEYTTTETRYKLPSYESPNQDRKRIKCSEKIICADGKCINQTYAVNDEMGESLAMLKALQEMQKQFSDNPITIFTGKHEWCKKKAFGLNNCCRPGKKKATVEKLNLSHCSSEEKSLAEKKDSGTCHFVGMKKEKMAGITKYKKYVYCCYDSILVKEIQVQGKKQLNKGFGDAEGPKCEGMTVDEIQRLDFEQIDLAPVFKEIFDSYNLSSAKQEIDRVKQTLQNELDIIGASTSNKKGEAKKLEGENPKYEDGGLL